MMLGITEWFPLILTIYGIITVIVKITPTLSSDNRMLTIIKLIGKLTNRQVNDKDIRTGSAKKKKSKRVKK